MTVLLPGLTVEVVAPTAPPTPLRTDVAGFIGATRKGAIGVAVRTSGMTDFVRRFGGLDRQEDTAYAVRGYFENDGQVAWIVRVSGRVATARATWDPALAGFPGRPFLVKATSPGRWADNTQVDIQYRSNGLAGRPEVDVRVAAPDEPVEAFTGLEPAMVPEELQASDLIRVTPDPDATPAPAQGPRRSYRWSLTLGGGDDGQPGIEDYLAAIRTLAEQPEVAIVVAPDLSRHLDGLDRDDAIDALASVAAETLDRLILLDVPPGEAAAGRAAAWVGSVTLRQQAGARDVAAYHPYLLVSDPLGTAAEPLRPLPPSGHVAGLISRLDRERGPHHSPANAELRDAVDLSDALSEREEALLYGSGINLLRCVRGRGIQVWGGRTPETAGQASFVAHRRLVHQLVRAVRAVATPLVFDVNGPELRLTLVRGVTSVLLAAFQAGVLKGSRPDEAFRVRCDETNNPPEQDPGLVVCEIGVAPAAPMEFIKLRLVMGAEGRLEVIEA